MFNFDRSLVIGYNIPGLQNFTLTRVATCRNIQRNIQTLERSDVQYQQSGFHIPECIHHPDCQIRIVRINGHVHQCTEFLQRRLE